MAKKTKPLSARELLEKEGLTFRPHPHEKADEWIEHFQRIEMIANSPDQEEAIKSLAKCSRMTLAAMLDCANIQPSDVVALVGFSTQSALAFKESHPIPELTVEDVDTNNAERLNSCVTMMFPDTPDEPGTVVFSRWLIEERQKSNPIIPNVVVIAPSTREASFALEVHPVNCYTDLNRNSFTTTWPTAVAWLLLLCRDCGVSYSTAIIRDPKLCRYSKSDESWYRYKYIGGHDVNWMTRPDVGFSPVTSEEDAKLFYELAQDEDEIILDSDMSYIPEHICVICYGPSTEECERRLTNRTFVPNKNIEVETDVEEVPEKNLAVAAY